MKLLIVLFSVMMVGCSNSLMNIGGEHVKLYYPNGNLKSDTTFFKNVKNGPVVIYFENGLLATKGSFKDDERDKEWRFYDEKTGKLIAIENYDAGLLEGEQYYYYPDGTLKLQGSYSANKRVGFWQMYDEKGNLSVQNIYMGSDGDISVALYQENGNILCTGPIENGFRNGIWKYFDSDGKALYDVEYKKGVRDGEWKAYDRDGQLMASGYYSNGGILGVDR